MLGVVRQPCVNLLEELAVLLPVADSMAGGHFLSPLHFPSCNNSLMGKSQAQVSQERFFLLLYCFVPLVCPSRVQRAQLEVPGITGVTVCPQLSQRKELGELFKAAMLGGEARSCSWLCHKVLFCLGVN